MGKVYACQNKIIARTSIAKITMNKQPYVMILILFIEDATTG